MPARPTLHCFLFLARISSRLGVQMAGKPLPDCGRAIQAQFRLLLTPSAIFLRDGRRPANSDILRRSGLTKAVEWYSAATRADVRRPRSGYFLSGIKSSNKVQTKSELLPASRGGFRLICIWIGNERRTVRSRFARGRCHRAFRHNRKVGVLTGIRWNAYRKPIDPQAAHRAKRNKVPAMQESSSVACAPASATTPKKPNRHCKSGQDPSNQWVRGHGYIPVRSTREHSRS